MERNPAPTGTKHSGYAGPEDGPFRCGTCVWFESGKQASHAPGECEHPKVKADQDLKKSKDGDAIVDAGGCCEYQRSRKAEPTKVAPYKSTLRRT